jgi:hypothetical protein
VAAGDYLSVLSHGLLVNAATATGGSGGGVWDASSGSRSDWRFWPEREDVTYRVRTAVAGTYTDHSLTATGGAAKRRATGLAEPSPSYGVARASRLVWLLPDEVLPDSVTPVPGDIVQDDDEVDWTVLSVDKNKWGQTWRAQTISLAIANSLSVTGTLSRPSTAQDTAGRQSLASYSLVGNSACRVQPEDSQADPALLDRRTMPRRYTAFLATPLAARAKDRFVVGAVTYTVTGLRFPERLDELFRLDLELVL